MAVTWDDSPQTVARPGATPVFKPPYGGAGRDGDGLVRQTSALVGAMSFLAFSYQGNVGLALHDQPVCLRLTGIEISFTTLI